MARVSGAGLIKVFGRHLQTSGAALVLVAASLAACDSGPPKLRITDWPNILDPYMAANGYTRGGDDDRPLILKNGVPILQLPSKYCVRMCLDTDLLPPELYQAVLYDFQAALTDASSSYNSDLAAKMGIEINQPQTVEKN